MPPPTYHSWKNLPFDSEFLLFFHFFIAFSHTLAHCEPFQPGVPKNCGSESTSDWPEISLLWRVHFVRMDWATQKWARNKILNANLQ
jgi:hypothetical protein